MATTRLLLLAMMAAVAWPAAAADRIPVADEGAIGDRWSAVPGTLFAPAYPEAYAGAGQEQVCVVIGYLIGADGHTSEFSLLKSWSSGSNARSRPGFWEAFAGDASRALSLWEFRPGPGVAPRPVYTAATFVFGPGNPAETKAKCTIPDLAQRLVELRYDTRAGRRMAAGIFPRLDIDPAIELWRQRRATTQRENLDGTERGLNIVPELPHPPNHP